MGANAKGVQTLTKCKTQNPKIKVSVMLLCPLLEVVFRQERETRYRVLQWPGSKVSNSLGLT